MRHRDRTSNLALAHWHSRVTTARAGGRGWLQSMMVTAALCTHGCPALRPAACHVAATSGGSAWRGVLSDDVVEDARELVANEQRGGIANDLGARGGKMRQRR